MTPPPLPQNPAWQNDVTLADALRTAADFIGSDKTRDHIERNLLHDKRCIYTLEIFRDGKDQIHTRLIVSANTTILTRKNLEWNGSAQLPPRILKDEA